MKHMPWYLAGLVALNTCISPVVAEEMPTPGRQELRRTDVAGAPGMEVVLSVHEWKPGDEIVAHFHHGIEAGYFIEGGTVQAPGAPVRVIAPGTPIWNLRDVTHAGFRVIGDKTIKLVTVHIVDKGKPMYDVKQ